MMHLTKYTVEIILTLPRRIILRMREGCVCACVCVLKFVYLRYLKGVCVARKTNGPKLSKYSIIISYQTAAKILMKVNP